MLPDSVPDSVPDREQGTGNSSSSRGRWAPRGSNAPRGITDPYRYMIHTASRLPWVHHGLTAHRQSVSCMRAARRCKKKQPSGLNGPVSLRASRVRRTEVLLQLLYLRSIEPGIQSQCQGIQGKCWIDPGKGWIGLVSHIGPEMDCIWLLLSRFGAVLDPFDPVPDPSGPCSGHIRADLAKRVDFREV